jgi:hypothetical protein
MRRIHIFLLALTVTAAVLLTLALVSWVFSLSSPNNYANSWMNQMWGGTNSNNYGGMGGMMGGSGGTVATASTSYLWVIPLVLGIGVAVAIVGVVFYLAFPELKFIKTNTTCNPSIANSQIQTQTINPPAKKTNTENIEADTPQIANSCDVLLKTMTPEEKKVLNVLMAHNGKYLQKYVVKEAELSRLKTHRIVARFAERGIVNIKVVGNTNEIVVSDWVTK